MRFVFSALVGVASLSSSLAAQPASATADTGTAALPRWSAGLGVDIGQPVGDLKRQVDNTVGAHGHLLLRLDNAGRVAMRLEGGWLNYGDESNRICLANTPGCRVAVNVTTANGILTLGVGPQLSLPLGPVRTYGYGLVGMSRFSTVSSIGGGLVPDIVAGDENFGDGGVVWSGGVGLQLPVRRYTTIDIGIAFQAHGRRNYLLEGGVTDRPDGSLAFDIKRSNANLVSLRLGATTRFPWFQGKKHAGA